MNPLQKVSKERKPMMKFFVAGVSGCLMQEKVPLCLFLEPLSLKIILNTKEMTGLIEQMDMYTADEKTQAIASAAKTTLKMKGQDKIQMINDVLTVGSNIIMDYTRAGGWLNDEVAATSNNWSQTEGVYPLRFVKTQDEADTLSAESENEEMAYIPITFLTDDEVLEVVKIIKDLAASMRQSDEPVIPIQTVEGGEEGISPKDMNAFPSTI